MDPRGKRRSETFRQLQEAALPDKANAGLARSHIGFITAAGVGRYVGDSNPTRVRRKWMSEIKNDDGSIAVEALHPIAGTKLYKISEVTEHFLKIEELGG